MRSPTVHPRMPRSGWRRGRRRSREILASSCRTPPAWFLSSAEPLKCRTRLIGVSSGGAQACDQAHGLEVGVEEVLEHDALAAGALVVAQPLGDLVDGA